MHLLGFPVFEDARADQKKLNYFLKLWLTLQTPVGNIISVTVTQISRAYQKVREMNTRKTKHKKVAGTAEAERRTGFSRQHLREVAIGKRKGSPSAVAAVKKFCTVA